MAPQDLDQVKQGYGVSGGIGRERLVTIGAEEIVGGQKQEKSKVRLDHS